jgi:hypothetical protein
MWKIYLAYNTIVAIQNIAITQQSQDIGFLYGSFNTGLVEH